MNRDRWVLRLAMVLGGLILWLAAALQAGANTVTISPTPPGVTTRVAPNIVVTFDDSGSMNSTSIPDSMDANYTQPYYYSSTFNGLYFDPTVTYVVPPGPPGGTMSTPSYTHAPRDGYCTSLANRCWSPNNGGYLNPNYVDLSATFYSGYLANINAGNAPCPRDPNEVGWYTNGNNCGSIDIPPALRALNSQSTTQSGTCNNRNCTNGTTTTSSTSGNTVTTVTTVTSNCSGNGNNRRCSTSTTTATSTVDNGGFYYTCTTQTNCTYHSLSTAGAAMQANFAIWYSYYRTRNMMARAGVGRVFGALTDSSVRVGWQTLQSQTSSANYYTGAGGYAGLPYGPLNLAGTNNASLVLPLVNAPTGCTSTTTSSNNCWRSKFMNWIYGVPASGSTPTRVALQTMGKLYTQTLKSTSGAPGAAPLWNDSTSSPAELACRKNFSMLVTDGYWNGDSPSTPAVLDNKSQVLPDGTAYTPGQTVTSVFSNDTTSQFPASLANIAFNYWATNLRPDLPQNLVPPYFPDQSTGVTGPVTTVSASNPGATPEVYFNPANDPATWQHVTQYMVTLGAPGTLTNNAATLQQLRTGQISWPLPTTAGGSTNIDDTWHAALDSRGGFFNAADPSTLFNTLNTILASVIASSSSSVGVSLQAQTLQTGSVAYEAGYNTGNWSGTLSAVQIDAFGNLGASVWNPEAGAQLTQRNTKQDARVVVTSSGPGTATGVGLSWGNLGSAAQAILNSPDGSGTSSDGNGAARLAWVGGDRSNEGSLLRSRNGLLGAIFNAQPVYVAAPSSGLSDTFPAGSPEALALAANPANSYSAFASKYANRNAVLYAAANDGLLHAFDARLASVTGASPGRELWAFLPVSVYPRVPTLSSLTNFSFLPTVDGTPVTGDVFFQGSSTNNGSWHTILVGGLRFGGRGIYAIDVTDPSTMTSSANVAGKVLWEFNSDSAANSAGNPANLGYTFGVPQIARLSTGKWVVLVPGGYFPDGSAAAAAQNTYSSLFVLDAQTGTLLKEIQTPAKITSYGLSTLALGDYNGDQITDVGFAGDLAGNLWRFDFAAALAASSASAGVSQLFAPATPGAQSITIQPRLIADPTSLYFMVIFGTGRFLSPADTADTTVQAMYGVRDPGNSTAAAQTVSSLVAQTMVETAGGVIGVTTNQVAPSNGGWYLPLNANSGERVVVTPFLVPSTNAVVFTTLIPATGDPCTTSLSGSLLALNAVTGGAYPGNPFGGSGTGLPNGSSASGVKLTQVASGGSLQGASGSDGNVHFGTSSNGTSGGGNCTGSNCSNLNVRRGRHSWHILNTYEN